MAQPGGQLLWKIADSDEVDIETRRDEKSAAHRTTIWIVPTEDGVYIRSYKGKEGRWYREALANPVVTIYRGRERVRVRIQQEKSEKVIREVSDAYKTKYGDRWPSETEPMLRKGVLSTTLRLDPL
jgi:hypothetical protein